MRPVRRVLPARRVGGCDRLREVFELSDQEVARPVSPGGGAQARRLARERRVSEDLAHRLGDLRRQAVRFRLTPAVIAILRPAPEAP